MRILNIEIFEYEKSADTRQNKHSFVGDYGAKRVSLSFKKKNALVDQSK